MNTQMINTAAPKMPAPVKNGLPDEAISKIHKDTSNQQLLFCAAAFLRRIGN